MKTELEQKLLKKYPEFFQTDLKIYTGEKPMEEEVGELLNQKEMVLPIQFGFECGDGWYMLLDELMSEIQNRIKNVNRWRKKEGGPVLTIQIDQIKEKFGGLRFYYSGGDDEISGMVDLAESLSYHICENCGSTKDIGYTKGWITTMCKDCYEKHPQKEMLRWELHEDK